MRTIDVDVLVVGTGFGAAAPALRLARAGHRVVMIEKGPWVEAPRDFRQTQDPKYLLRYLHSLPGRSFNLTYAEALGGGSGFYEMISIRAPSVAFERTDEAGRRLWPAGVDRAALDPWFGIAEEMLHVRQIREEEVPKTGLVFSLFLKRLGYSCDRVGHAVNGCLQSGFCVTGCIYGAKQSLHLNYLPQSRAAGARVIAGLEAVSVRPLGAPAPAEPGAPLRRVPLRWEVVCRERPVDGGPEAAADGPGAGGDAAAGSRGGAPAATRRGQAPDGLRRFRARLVVLAGGSLGTASLLLASREHLPGLSPAVGRRLAFDGAVQAVGLLPDGMPDCDTFTGRSHPGMVSYEFLESHGVTVTAAKPFPLQAVAAARFRLRGAPEDDWWGEPHVELMKRYRRRMMILCAFGMPPGAARLELRDGRPRVSLELTPALRRYHERTRELLESILVRNGCRLVDPEFVDREGKPFDDLRFSTAHQLGTCPMADSPERGVADASGEVFGCPGLYVSDGSALPGPLPVSPSLTILANAERIAAGIVGRYSPEAPAASWTARRRPGVTMSRSRMSRASAATNA